MLKPEKDPMGHAVSDYYSHRSSDKLIVKSDTAEPDEIPVSYLFRSPAEMPDVEIAALEACRGTVLDIGAGAGAHSLALKGMGFRVTSIDISRLSVDVMKSRGVDDAQCINFYNQDFNKKYDTLLFLMNGVGIAGTLAGLDGFLSCCIVHLKTGGQILLDSSDIGCLFDSDEDFSGQYYGEVLYQMIYKDIYSELFRWLFVDFDTLERACFEKGLSCTMLMEGENNSYLARLSLG